MFGKRQKAGGVAISERATDKSRPKVQLSQARQVDDEGRALRMPHERTAEQRCDVVVDERGCGDVRLWRVAQVCEYDSIPLELQKCMMGHLVELVEHLQRRQGGKIPAGTRVESREVMESCGIGGWGGGGWLGSGG